MGDHLSAAYRVWVHPGDRYADREYVESASDQTAARPVMDYLGARLPKGDTVKGDWGGVPAEARRFDYRRLTEPQNDWKDADGPAPGRPLVLEP